MRFFSLVVLCAAIISSPNVHSQYFQRIASFETTQQFAKTILPSSAEIITATEDGKILLYTDSLRKGIGLINLTDPAKPMPQGFIPLEGEPTSISYAKDRIFTVINTSKSYEKPSGTLQVFAIKNQKKLVECPLGGQPDAIAISPDNRFLAIAIENERNEDLNGGALPQYPAGNLRLFTLKAGLPVCSSQKFIDLTGLADIAPSDPEPEFVDINSKNEVIVTLQENNHLVIVNAETGDIIRHFSAGAVDLNQVDIEEERKLTFDGQLKNVKREPDAVKWLDNRRFITANEGDYQGGSRGFTIYHKDGRVLHESKLDLEYRAALAGHYPEKRSGNKGIEPEGIAVGKFNGENYFFVMAERASIVGVYKDTGSTPEFVQLLPSGISPESGIAIPQRNLFVTANEKDLGKKDGIRSQVMVYQYGKQNRTYPQLSSEFVDGKPIGWGALSGLTVDPQQPYILYAVNDHFYQKQPSIFVIDTQKIPAKIVKRIDILTKNKLDIEGITSDGKKGFYLISEGNPKKSMKNHIIHVNKDGVIQREILFPPTLESHANRYGGEGIAKIEDTLWVAIQRPWENDPENTVKFLAYDLRNDTWSAVHYPLTNTKQGWVGVSELTAFNDDLYVIERDNQHGLNAVIKQITRIDKSQLQPMPLSGSLPIVTKTVVRNLLPDFGQFNGVQPEKIEGFALTSSGKGFLVTDNEGVDNSSGETLFFSIDFLTK
jgi:hypothetical protein